MNRTGMRSTSLDVLVRVSPSAGEDHAAAISRTRDHASRERRDPGGL
jgi:hypothetical protein